MTLDLRMNRLTCGMRGHDWIDAIDPDAVDPDATPENIDICLRCGAVDHDGSRRSVLDPPGRHRRTAS
jgi:hypothetical protein